MVDVFAGIVVVDDNPHIEVALVSAGPLGYRTKYKGSFVASVIS